MNFIFLFVSLIMMLICGCTTTPVMTTEYAPKTLLDAACQVGRTVESVQGHLWLKGKSKEMSGQFPADIHVQSPSQLQLEITNILGGTEAIILVADGHYEIKRKNKKEAQGSNAWVGIPLQWMVDLFIGRLPCPEPSKKWKLSTNPSGDLIVEGMNLENLQTERYTYHFRNHRDPHRDQPWVWVDHLRWERLEKEKQIDSIEFTFDDPEDQTMSPKKWEAQSIQGTLRVRWSSRHITLFTK